MAVTKGEGQGVSARDCVSKGGDEPKPRGASLWRVCSLAEGGVPGSCAGWQAECSFGLSGRAAGWSGQGAEASSSESRDCWGLNPRRPESLGFSGFRTLDFSGMSFLVRNEEQKPGTLGSRGGCWGSPELRFPGLWPLFCPDEGQSLLRPLPAITILGHKF